MAKKKKLTVAVANVTLEPPHSPERYFQLIEAVISKEKPIAGKIGGDSRLMLDYYASHDAVVSGAFARFTYIDPGSPWWDSRNRKAILNEKGQPVPQVREGIGPNLKQVNFIFMLDGHRVVFDVRNISPGGFLKGLMGIFSDPFIANEFGPVNVTIEPEHDAIDKILAVPNKRKIYIKFSMPNGDVPSLLEEDILRRYREMDLGSTEQTYTALSGMDLKVDKEIDAKMKIASQNGFATVSGRDESHKRVVMSTKDYPLKASKYVDVGTYWNAFGELANSLVSRLKGGRPGDGK
ncbi:DUF4747 family protein [Desulfocurvus vexinensis]|uniref:DUF4747 family protein n=1 Tax=Desulfocurvus vexinensis TaxID=399548 RepID=UPI000A048A1D|nr:DUF4747 family protein [Desulfocurvus vexinensis]